MRREQLYHLLLLPGLRSKSFNQNQVCTIEISKDTRRQFKIKTTISLIQVENLSGLEMAEWPTRRWHGSGYIKIVTGWQLLLICLWPH